jgi:nucleoside-diphosphate-sugar epimerase
MKVLFAGFGDLARRAAYELAGGPFDLAALGRSVAPAIDGLTPFHGDVTRPETLSKLAGHHFDALVITLTPGGRDEDAYRKIFIEGLGNLLSGLAGSPPGLVLFASSTSVYHQSDGQWVDEDTVVQPTRFAGRVLLEAESLLPANSVAIRFGGLYGEGSRYMLDQLRAGGRYPARPVCYSNRLHRVDAGAVLAHLLHSYQQGLTLPGIINAVDGRPTPIYEVSKWLCEQMGLPAEAKKALTSRAGSKRVANQRLLDTGYKLRYEDFKAGYGPELSFN